MCIKDTLEDDEPIPNMGKFFAPSKSSAKDGGSRKKKKSEPSMSVVKRQKLGKIDKVILDFNVKIFKQAPVSLFQFNYNKYGQHGCTCSNKTYFLQVPSTHTIGPKKVWNKIVIFLTF